MKFFPDDYQGKRQATTGLDFVSLAQENCGIDGNNPGFRSTFESQKHINLTSWEDVLEHCTIGFHDAPFQPSVSSTQSAHMGIISKQENVILGQLFTDKFNIKQEEVGESQRQDKWQVCSRSNVLYIIFTCTWVLAIPDMV